MRFNINANISLGMTAVEALNPYLVFVYTKRMLLFLPVGNMVLLPLGELVLLRVYSAFFSWGTWEVNVNVFSFDKLPVSHAREGRHCTCNRL